MPEGIDEDGNVEIARWGSPRAFDFTPREHPDFAGPLGLDFEAAAAMSGARFAVLRGGVAKLNRALGQFMLDAQAKRRQELRAAGKPLSETTTGIVSSTSPWATHIAIAAPDDLYASMNKTERRRAVELEAMKRAGVIQRWEYEAVTFKLATGLRYTPDFMVIGATGIISFEETKGHWREDARAKIKMAASKFACFAFVALVPRKKRDGGGWKREAF